MATEIDSMIEKAVSIGVKASEKITFTDVKNASKFFRDLIESEIIIKLRKKINPDKTKILSDYLKDLAILGYTLSKAGIYDELSLEQFTELIKRNKPINIIAFGLKNPDAVRDVDYKENDNSLNVA